MKSFFRKAMGPSIMGAMTLFVSPSFASNSAGEFCINEHCQDNVTDFKARISTDGTDTVINGRKVDPSNPNPLTNPAGRIQTPRGSSSSAPIPMNRRGNAAQLQNLTANVTCSFIKAVNIQVSNSPETIGLQAFTFDGNFKMFQMDIGVTPSGVCDQSTRIKIREYGESGKLSLNPQQNILTFNR